MPVAERADGESAEQEEAAVGAVRDITGQPEEAVRHAVLAYDCDIQRAINYLLDSAPGPPAPAAGAKRKAPGAPPGAPPSRRAAPGWRPVALLRSGRLPENTVKAWEDDIGAVDGVWYPMRTGVAHRRHWRDPTQ